MGLLENERGWAGTKWRLVAIIETREKTRQLQLVVIIADKSVQHQWYCCCCCSGAPYRVTQCNNWMAREQLCAALRSNYTTLGYKDFSEQTAYVYILQTLYKVDSNISDGNSKRSRIVSE